MTPWLIVAPFASSSGPVQSQHLPRSQSSYSHTPAIRMYVSPIALGNACLRCSDVLDSQRDLRQLSLPHHYRNLCFNRRCLFIVHPHWHHWLSLVRRQHPGQHRLHVSYCSRQHDRPPCYRYSCHVLIPSPNSSMSRQLGRMREVAPSSTKLT